MIVPAAVRRRFAGAVLTAVAVLAMAPGPAGAADSAANGATAAIEAYLAAWVDFYPSEAYAYGYLPSAGRFEAYGTARLADWLALNARTRGTVEDLLAGPALPPARRADLEVLRGQVEDELARWAEAEPLEAQPQWYAEQASQALTHLLVRAAPGGAARSEAAVARLRGVEALCELGVRSLIRGKRGRTDYALRTLRATRAFYEGDLPVLAAAWPPAGDGTTVAEAASEAAAALAALEVHLETHVLPTAAESPAIGADVYAARLARRTGGLYTPEQLREVARDEVAAVRRLMVQEAERWRAALPAEARRTLAGRDSLAAAIEAMEAERDNSGAALLATFERLTAAAERFVLANGIATVPQPTTLSIALSPAHFSGAAVGGVYPSGPFAPDAATLFYVPSIPDDAPAAAREGFYRSFNTHFNTMIISHEMFPGHYLQYKVAVSEAPRVRVLFPNGPYVEGWGSFVEELMLDAGWAGNAPLTSLAHLRKRLENATRAYVSVQVNSAGWGREEVLRFGEEEGLLAPQFALNLWQRVVTSPLQITDYLTGYLAFRRLHDAYRAADPGAPLRPWVDAVLRAGPLPLGLLPSELPAAPAAPAPRKRTEP